MQLEGSRTHHANQAVELSELIRLKFARHRFGVESPRVLRVSEPDGPSTDGGRKARQSIVLTPERVEVLATAPGPVVCGWLDIAQRSAELKSYDLLARQYEGRFHAPLDLAREEYDLLVAELQDFFREVAIESRIQTTARPSEPPPMPRQLIAVAPAAAAVPGPDWLTHILWGVAGGIFGFGLCYVLIAAHVLIL